MNGTFRDIALVAAGVIGVLTAGVHGVVMQRHMIVPIQAILDESRELSRVTQRLVSPLLHVSTVAWLVVGCLLIWAGARATSESRWIAVTLGLLIYGHAAIANLVSVRGLHPGWILMSAAVALILIAIV